MFIGFLLSFTNEFHYRMSGINLRDFEINCIQRIITRLLPLLPKTCFISGTLGIKSKCIFSWGLITCQFQIIEPKEGPPQLQRQPTTTTENEWTQINQTPAEQKNDQQEQKLHTGPSRDSVRWNILTFPSKSCIMIFCLFKKATTSLMFAHYEGILALNTFWGPECM